MKASIQGRKSAFVCLLALAACATAVAPDAKAQTLYGTLVGNVSDPSNASIGAAKVAAVNTGTGFSREALTDDRGGYLFSDLQPGAYRITVTAPGFAVSTQTDVQVSTNAVRRVDVACNCRPPASRSPWRGP